MDAGRNPVTGADPVPLAVRSGLGGAAGRVRRDDRAAANAARLAADIAACVPYNPFGGPDNSASVAYFARTFTAGPRSASSTVTGFVSGDSSQLFELPGGPVRFALGAEYRKETASYEQDPFVTDGFTNGVSIPSFEPDPFKVKEAFGEIRCPILKDTPFFEELTLSGAGRVAKYQGDVGTVWSYNARRRLGAGPRPPLPRQLQPRGPRAERFGNRLPAGSELRTDFTDPCNPAIIGTAASARPTASPISAVCSAT